MALNKMPDVGITKRGAKTYAAYMARARAAKRKRSHELRVEALLTQILTELRRGRGRSKL